MARTSTPPTLVIICGLPGSGKTTHARCLEEAMPAVRLCPDEWMDALGIDLYDVDGRDRIEQLQWVQGKRLLSLGLSVLIEWGTWGRSERDTLREEGHALGARVELHFLTAPVDVLHDRIRRRARENPPISREDIERWTRHIQVPDENEMALFDAAKTIAS